MLIDPKLGNVSVAALKNCANYKLVTKPLQPMYNKQTENGQKTVELC